MKISYRILGTRLLLVPYLKRFCLADLVLGIVCEGTMRGGGLSERFLTLGTLDECQKEGSGGGLFQSGLALISGYSSSVWVCLFFFFS